MLKRLMVAAAALAVSLPLSAPAAGKPVLPKGYQKWEKSRQKIVEDRSSLFYGIHYIYVDPKAMKGYRTGGPYAEGARFVVEFFNIDPVKKSQGKKNMVVLMKRDKSAAKTGGWLFAGFNADGSYTDLDPVKTCFECHVKDAKDRYYVISRFSEFH